MKWKTNKIQNTRKLYWWEIQSWKLREGKICKLEAKAASVKLLNCSSHIHILQGAARKLPRWQSSNMVYVYVEGFAANSYVDEFSSLEMSSRSTYVAGELVDGGSRSEWIDVAKFAAIWWPTCRRQSTINWSLVESVFWNESEERQISLIQTRTENHSNRRLGFISFIFVDPILMLTLT